MTIASVRFYFHTTTRKRDLALTAAHWGFADWFARRIAGRALLRQRLAHWAFGYHGDSRACLHAGRTARIIHTTMKILTNVIKASFATQ